MKNIEKIKIFKETKIKKALKIISDGGLQIALVVDKKDKLIGTLTDGDIRKGFLRGMNLDSSINSIISKNPICAKKDYNKKKLLKIAISKKIYQIPIVDDNGKLIDVYVLHDILKLKKKNNKVVLMAGGEGMRLRPLTENTPKPMLKVANSPILETIIKKFRESGYCDIIICVNYKSHVIENYFGDGTKFGVKIKYVKEKKKMGTAGALSLIKEKLTEPFFLMNGDLLTNLNFDRMLEFHQERQAIATMCVREHIIESRYGEVHLDEENITSIEEKPVHKFFMNGGIYLLEPECIKYVPKKYFDMPSLFKKLILRGRKTISFPFKDYWVDIGKLIDYKKANKDFFEVF